MLVLDLYLVNRRFAARARALIPAIFSLILWVTVSPCAGADTAMTEAARELARRLSAELSPKQSLHLEFRDLSDTPAADLSEARRAFEDELTSRGFRLLADVTPNDSVRVSLSQDSQERLWVAEFARDGKAAVAIVDFAFASPGSVPRPAPISIQRQFVFDQLEPVFDFALAGPPADASSPLLVLGPAGVVLFRYNKNQWQMQTSVSLSQEKPLPRDAQGQLTLTSEGFDAHVADIYCTGNAANMAAMQCGANAQSVWRITGPNNSAVTALPASGKNWFDWGALADAPAGESKRPAFFSLAALSSNGKTLWVAAGLDGTTRVYAGASAEPLTSFSGWGSTLAGIRSNCGNGWQILATRAADYTAPDAVQAYQWTGNEFRPAGAAIEFDGPIVALRASMDLSVSRAVVHNLQTGFYEGYTLTLSCGR